MDLSFYEGTQNNNIVIAEITDVSGINSTTLFYNVDGVGPNLVSGINTSGNNYSFTIPAQNPGSMISYKIKAVDNASSPNQTDTSIATQYKYISGTYLAYDDGIVDAVATTTGTAAVAVKVSVSYKYVWKIGLCFNKKLSGYKSCKCKYAYSCLE